MRALYPHEINLLNWIDAEIKEQRDRFKRIDGTNLAQFRALGILIYPIQVTRKSFGYADYPEIAFNIPYPADISGFRDGAAIECFIEGEEPVRGTLQFVEGKKGSVQLIAPDFPDWIEDKGVGIKLAPDDYTNKQMREAVKNIATNERLNTLFQQLYENKSFETSLEAPENIDFKNASLNDSQKSAVKAILVNEHLTLVHGPPGTGKTTTLLESIVQLARQGKKVLVSAPSNAAVDNVARGLIQENIALLRVGNTTKVDAAIYPYTLEGKLNESKERKEIKRLKIQAEEYRRMALSYKRNFGKEERQQRSLLFKEVHKIRDHIKSIRSYVEEKMREEAQVILGTPIGISNALKDEMFDVLIIDEAGQMLEPLAWLIFPYAKSWVLAGDPFQLPPTVISDQAAKNGFNVSILERCFEACPNIHFLDTQYRMRSVIAGFSNDYFYGGKLQTPKQQEAIADHLFFYDTAGTGFEESPGANGTSLSNLGEVDLVQKILQTLNESSESMGFISPYSGQVQEAISLLPEAIRVSTIDSFQGQEMPTIIVSLVRSNADGTIGFLSDYRRMNVALTRAKERLIVIGDSSTIGLDPFYAAFLDYCEKHDAYHSAWELMG